MRKLLALSVIIAIIIAILAVIVVYSYVTVSNGPINPLGRLSFVKIENPDMYPGHPHALLLGEDAAQRGSACALVVHFAGSSNYRSFQENINSTSHQNGSVYIIEAAYIDTQGSGSSSLKQNNIFDSLKVAIYGVTDGRYKYVSDGNIYNTYDELMSHVNTLAKENGQQGPLPMVWHGTVRTDSPILDPGCGFPLYFQILSKTYGLIPAYVYMISGLISPYFSDPYAMYEITHSSYLQNLYNQGELNHDFVNTTSITSSYMRNVTNTSIGNYD